MNSVSVYSLVYQCINKEIVRWQRIVVYQGGMKGTAEKKNAKISVVVCFFNYFTFSSYEDQTTSATACS